MDGASLEDSDLIAALGLLFSANSGNFRELLDSIQESDIKKAYHKKALQTHPDRFVSLGEDFRKLCSDRFIKVNNAYEVLSAYLKRPKCKELNGRPRYTARNVRSTGESVWRRPGERVNFSEGPGNFYTQSFWQKEVPGRHLRFAEFLYYNGVIPWKTFIRSLVWQSKQRPRIGEIAQKWRWLSEFQIISLLRDRRPGELIGQVLLHNGVISPFQLNVLLWQQKKRQKPIGEYFVESGLLSRGQIRDILLRQQGHNLIYRAERPIYSTF